ncbi:hypothetical protein VAEKB19_3250004 [Vibrio aestuarianus]|nr:hypothetical protein VAEKB19_3250004 [Vibrio aestuarianus]
MYGTVGGLNYFNYSIDFKLFISTKRHKGLQKGLHKQKVIHT